MNNNIDTECLPLVQYFNELGLITEQSCQGHNDTNMSMFWIEFHEDITEDDIIEFQCNHLDEHGCFISNGRFAKRLFVCCDDGEPAIHSYFRWHYFAATIMAAREDLRRWKDMDDCL